MPVYPSSRCFYRGFTKCTKAPLIAVLWLPFFLPLTSPAQAPSDRLATDSLRTIIENIPTDTAKVSFLYQYVKDYYDSGTSANRAALANYCARQALVIAKNTPDNKYKALAQMATGLVLIRQNQYGKALFHTQRGKQLSATCPDRRLQMLAARYLAINYYFLNNWPKALEHNLTSLRLAEKLGEKRGVAKVSESIGQIMIHQRDYPQGLAYNRQAVAIYRQIGDKPSLSNCYNTIGSIYELQDDYQRAIGYYRVASQLARELSDESLLLGPLFNTGVCYQSQGKVREALPLLEQSAVLARKLGDEYYLATCYQGLGEVYQALQRYPEAKAAYQKCVAIARKMNSPQVLMDGLDKLTSFYEETNDHRRAFDTQRAYHVLQDSLFKIERIKVTSELRLKYEAEKKEQRIASLQKENQARKVIIWIFCLAVILTFGIMAFLVRAYRLQKQVHRQHQCIAEQEKTQRQLQLRLDEEEKRRLQLEVAAQQRELATNTLYVQQKDRLLEGLHRQLGELSVAGGEREVRNVREMSRAIRQNISFAEDWGKIKTHFEGVHPDFFKKLLTICPQLTENEQKHCAYVRMKLSTKEVAKLLGVDADSVKMSRYRIKKKLSLEVHQDLNEHIFFL